MIFKSIDYVEPRDAANLIAEKRDAVQSVSERRGVVEFVDDCLRHPKHDRRRDLPLTILWNPRGNRPSGKSYGGRAFDECLSPSELLDQLEKYFGRGRPYVRRNGGEFDELRPHEVAARLASELSCRVEAFGQLKFPRLLIGLGAIRSPIAEISAITERRPLIELLREVTPDLLNLAPPGTRLALGIAVKGLLAFAGALVPPSVRRGLRWYQDELNEHRADDPFSVLVRLKEYESSKRTQGRVDEALCRAFLADLQDGYSTKSLRIFKRRKNCLVLIDDANSNFVRSFLDTIAAQRQRQGWDPLLIVVAVSPRSPLPDHQHPEDWEFQSVAEATYRDWSTNRTMKQGWEAWYPLCVSCR